MKTTAFFLLLLINVCAWGAGITAQKLMQIATFTDTTGLDNSLKTAGFITTKQVYGIMQLTYVVSYQKRGRGLVDDNAYSYLSLIYFNGKVGCVQYSPASWDEYTALCNEFLLTGFVRGATWLEGFRGRIITTHYKYWWYRLITSAGYTLRKWDITLQYVPGLNINSW